MRHQKPNQTIKQELKRRGISQVQAALDLEIPRTTLNLIANGWQVPANETRAKIANYLNRSVEELFSLKASRIPPR